MFTSGLVAKQNFIYWISYLLWCQGTFWFIKSTCFRTYTKEENIPEIILLGCVSLAT